MGILLAAYVVSAGMRKPEDHARVPPPVSYTHLLDQFRKNMLSDKRIKNIVDFIDSSSCFSGVDISGGICYFLWKRDYNGTCKFTSVIGNSTSTSFRYLDEFDIVIRHEKALKIIHKVKQNENHFMDEIVLPRRPFGLGSNLSLLKSGDVRVKSTSGYLSLIHI